MAAALWRLSEDDRNAEEDAIKNPQKNGGGGFGNPETNRLVEASAVNFVMAYLTKSGYSVRSREREKIGYDLDAVRKLEELHVEVKGTKDSVPAYILTQNERARAESDPAFRLYIVTDATGQFPQIHMFDHQSMEVAFEFQPLSYRATVRKFREGSESP